MNTRDKRYADILAEAKDPGMERLIADLDRVCRGHPASMPPPHLRVSIAHLLHERATADRPAGDRERRPHRPTWRHRHGLLAAAVVAVAALVTGSAFAASPLVNDIALFFNNGDVPAGSGPANNAPDQTPPLGTLGTPINLPRTVCGYTVTLNRLYADVNRVTVGYTLTWPAYRHYNGFVDIRPTLTDEYGAPLPMYNGITDLPKGNVNWNATIFDASSIATTTTPLTLHMTIPTIGLESAVPLAAPSACERVGMQVPDPVHPKAQVYPLTVTGPFTFAFTTPVTTSLRTADFNQTLTSSHGTSVTLERIMLTPTEARMYYRGPSEMYSAGGPPTLPVLYVDGKEIEGGFGKPLGGGRWSYSFGNLGINLYQNHSEWTLKFLTDPTMTNYRRAWTDSVTFHFTVP